MANSKSPNSHSRFDANRALVELTNQYQDSGKCISVSFRDIMRHLKAPERATHLIHPYPAKVLVHIPNFFLTNTILSKPGYTVLDPFCGSGTVVLEAMLSGRRAIGIDSNPLAHLISKVKTTPIDSNWLRKLSIALLKRIETSDRSKQINREHLQYWFYPHVLRQLDAIYKAIEATQDADVRDFFKVSFSVTVRRTSLANPRLNVPVKLNIDRLPNGHPLQNLEIQHLLWLKRVDVVRDFSDVLSTNIRRMEQFTKAIPDCLQAEVLKGDARSIVASGISQDNSNASIRPNTVNLIITSPPYPGAQKYVRASSLSLFWLNLCDCDDLRKLKALAIGREEIRASEQLRTQKCGVEKAETQFKRLFKVNPNRAAIAKVYLTEMRQALQEMYEVLTVGGHAVLVIADNSVCGERFPTAIYLTEIAEQVGFKKLLALSDGIRSRGLLTTRNNNADVISQESVIVLKKSKRKG